MRRSGYAVGLRQEHSLHHQASAHVSLGSVLPGCLCTPLPHHISFSEGICLLFLSSSSQSFRQSGEGRKRRNSVPACSGPCLGSPYCLVLVVNLLGQLEAAEFCLCPPLTEMYNKEELKRWLRG